MPNPARIVVSGASGFIGTALCRRLKVVFPSAQVVGFSRTGGVGRASADVTNAREVDRLVAGTDWVFHLAAFTRVPDVLQNPALGLGVNVVGTAHVLEASRNHGVARCMLISTGRVLGSPARLPAHEDLPLAPEEPYSAQKASAEMMGMAYYRAYGLGVTIIRPSIVYGPGRITTPGSMAGVMPRFAEALLSGSPLTIVGEGAQRSDFVHIDDVVDGLILAVAHEAAAGEVYHLGSGVGTSIRELVNIMSAAAGVEGAIEHLPATSDTVDLFLSNTKACEELGFAPRVALADGVADYIAWFRENRIG